MNQNGHFFVNIVRRRGPGSPKGAADGRKRYYVVGILKKESKITGSVPSVRSMKNHRDKMRVYVSRVWLHLGTVLAFFFSSSFLVTLVGHFVDLFSGAGFALLIVLLLLAAAAALAVPRLLGYDGLLLSVTAEGIRDHRSEVPLIRWADVESFWLERIRGHPTLSLELSNVHQYPGIPQMRRFPVTPAPHGETVWLMPKGKSARTHFRTPTEEPLVGIRLAWLRPSAKEILAFIASMHPEKVLQ